MSYRLFWSAAFSLTISMAATALSAQEAPKPQPLPDLSQPFAEQDARPQSRVADTPKAPQTLESVNAALTKAREANKNKQFKDAESLMLDATASKPELIYTWVELGLAQIGLQKFKDAENSFNIALGITPNQVKEAHEGDYYKEGSGSTQILRNTVTHQVINVKRTPEVEGISWSSLGEIYIHEKRIPEAKEAFDKAVKAYPAQASLYRRNEATFFFQIGDSPDQVEAANLGLAVDPNRPLLYFLKGQGLSTQSSKDPASEKVTLPPGCAEAFLKYLQLDPSGQFAPKAKSVLASAGINPPSSVKN